LGGDRAVCYRPDRRPLEARRLATRGNLLRAGGASTDAAGFALPDERECFEPDAFKLDASFRQKQPNDIRFARQFCFPCDLALVVHHANASDTQASVKPSTAADHRLVGGRRVRAGAGELHPQYQIDHGVPKTQAYNVTMYVMAALVVVGFFCN
jgi:hypothetical protein